MARDEPHKPDELTRDRLADIATDAIGPPLVIDGYLSRQGVIDHVVDIIGINITPSGSFLNHLELAALYRAISDDESRHRQTIRNDMAKYDIIHEVGDIYGFATSEDQDTLRKSQLVHILLTEVTGTRPDPFTLPSDPDPDHHPNDRAAPMGAD